MLSNIIMGFTTALSPANLIAVLGGGDCLKTRIVERSAAIRLPHPQWGV